MPENINKGQSSSDFCDVSQVSNHPISSVRDTVGSSSWSVIDKLSILTTPKQSSHNISNYIFCL